MLKSLVIVWIFRYCGATISGQMFAAKYKIQYKFSGSALQGKNPQKPTTCMRSCLEEDCSGFALKEGSSGGYSCLLTINPWDLPAGEWLMYGNTENVPFHTLIKRVSASVDFNRNWADYKAGFGSPDGNYWLGLEKAHILTTSHSYRLRIDLMLWNGTTEFSEYGLITIGDEADKYRISVSDFNSSSTADNAFYKNEEGAEDLTTGMQFTTTDSQNDLCGSWNCAEDHGGWWYNCCHYGHPTGEWQDTELESKIAVGWGNNYLSLKYIEMRLIPN